MTRRTAIAAFACALSMLLAVPVGFDLAVRPIASVHVTGNFEHLARHELERAIEPALEPGFLRVDVASVRGAALTLPWVREVSVRRVWPDRLDVTVVERSPVARWGDDALLEADGSLFRPDGGGVRAALPRLTGPSGSHRLVLQRYRELKGLLGEQLGAPIRQLDLDARGAWTAELANDLELILGAGPLPASFARYARAFPRVFGERLAQVQRLDMRYGNGFAVGWRASQAGTGS